MTVITETTTPGAQAPAAEELIARAAALVPLLRKNAAQTEQDRRVVEENIQALREAGLFKIAVPRRFGGLGALCLPPLQIAPPLGLRHAIWQSERSYGTAKR